MAGYVSVDLLKPHPKCAEYFSGPFPEEYEAVKRSIEAQGIRDPLKVAPDYTVIAGHLRLQIAKELGFEKVPVEIVDGDPEYLEYLLVADNEERRVCRDPVKKAKRAEFLARYWGVREGSANPKGTMVAREGKNYPHEEKPKTLADVAEAVGETRENLKKLLKLNDLIPPLQHLVSEGRLSQTAAYSLAFLPPGEQEELLRVLGESGVCGLSVAEARELRAELEEQRRLAEESAARLAELEEERRELQAKLAGAQELLEGAEEKIAERLGSQYEDRFRRAVAQYESRLREAQEEAEALRARLEEVEGNPVVRVVEKVVYRHDPAVQARLDASRAEAARLATELEALQKRLASLAADGERERTRAENLKKEKEALERRLEAMKEQVARLKKGGPLSEVPLRKELGRAAALAADLLLVLDAVLKHPDKLKELAGMAKAAGIAASSDPGEELLSAAGELVAALTLRQAVLALEAVGAKIAAVLELFDAEKGGSRHLRLVRKEGSR